MPTWMYPLLFLACPLGMGVMMWMMMRGDRTNSADGATGIHQADLARLQSEIDELKAAREERSAQLP